MALLLTLIIASSTLTELESEVKMILEESQPYVVTVTAGDMVASGTVVDEKGYICLLYTSPSPRDLSTSRMPSSA